MLTLNQVSALTEEQARETLERILWPTGFELGSSSPITSSGTQDATRINRPILIIGAPMFHRWWCAVTRARNCGRHRRSAR